MYRFNVKVSSMMFGADESGIEPIHFYSAVETLTVRGLIARTVEQQIQELLEKQKNHSDVVEKTRKILTRQYLSEEDIAEMSQEGSICIPEEEVKTLETTQIDAKKEIRYACEAFRQRRFFITVNGEQPMDLDDIVTLSENSTVLFVRIMPLVGG